MQIRVNLLLAALCACCGLGLSTEVLNPTTQKPVIIPVQASIPAVRAVINTGAKEDPAPKPIALDTPEITTSNSMKSDDSTKLEPSTDLLLTDPTTLPTIPPTTPTTTPPTTPTTTPPTTPPPTTPPTPTPAPSPAPTPAPGPPEQNTWAFHNETTNITCIVVQFAAQLKVTYAKANNTNTDSVILNVPVNASVVNGSCDDDNQHIILSWPVENSLINNTMTLNYQKNSTTKNYGLETLEFALSPDIFVNATSKDVLVLSHGCDWQTPLNTSYRCNPATRMNLTAASGAVAALTLSHLQEEAFRTTTGKGFSAARECGGGDLPDAVPIAVGCALGGLVLVVLAAYLVGRRRSAARGYLSM